jgi:ferredoxin
MPKLTIENVGSFDVESGTRLLNAIQEAGVDILHRCGGHAKCTTCRVSFMDGEPTRMTVAERDKLAGNGQSGEFRLACQCLVEQDMHVEPLMTLSSSGLDDAGPAPEAEITPEPEWVEAGA